MSKFYNTSLNRVNKGGGSQRVTLPGATTTTATSQACKFCRIQVMSTNTEVVRVRLDDTCSATTGVEIPTNPTLTPYTISNLNQLNFYSADTDAIVDIEYFD